METGLFPEYDAFSVALLDDDSLRYPSTWDLVGAFLFLVAISSPFFPWPLPKSPALGHKALNSITHYPSLVQYLSLPKISLFHSLIIVGFGSLSLQHYVWVTTVTYFNIQIGNPSDILASSFLDFLYTMTIMLILFSTPS